MLPPIPDARTTPPRLRLPALVLLVALGAWLGVCYRFALANLGVAEAPAALAAWGDLFWLGRWRMFTDARPTHTDLVAEARMGGASGSDTADGGASGSGASGSGAAGSGAAEGGGAEGGAWVAVDLAALYPSRWDEGPGYLRDDLLEHPRRLAVLADATCRRVPGGPERIRFTLVEWPKTPGQVEQPRDRATTQLLLDHPCGGEAGRR